MRNMEVKAKKVKEKEVQKTLKKARGITLIALVITIIVLLILAAVSIATLTGENGILTRATDAKEKTEKASVIEQAQTDLLAKQAENSSGDVTASDLKEVLDKYFNNVPEANNITTDTTLTTKDEYGGNYEISVSEIYNGEIKVEISVPEGLAVGSIVSYNPSGEYQWEPEYCGLSDDTDDIDVTQFTTLKSGEGEDFNLNTWRVFEINEKTGEVTLVPTHATVNVNLANVGNLLDIKGWAYLYGAQGYNNGVKLLNDACSALYGDSDKGITARNINIEDIEGKMTEEAKAYAYSESGYEVQVATPYEQRYSYYPSIYENERLSSIENEDSKELKMSQQESFIAPTDNGATRGHLQATSIQPYHTVWSGNNSFMQTAFKSENNVSYYDLLMPENSYYWVASRCVEVDASQCIFGMFGASSNGIGNIVMFYSNGYSNSPFPCGLFPLVSLSSNLIEGNEIEGFIVK